MTGGWAKQSYAFLINNMQIKETRYGCKRLNGLEKNLSLQSLNNLGNKPHITNLEMTEKGCKISNTYNI